MASSTFCLSFPLGGQLVWVLLSLLPKQPLTPPPMGTQIPAPKRGQRPTEQQVSWGREEKA